MPDYIEKLKSFDNLKLIDIVKNYKQYGYDDSLREIALNILKERGVSEEQLKISGNFENEDFNKAEELYKDFRKNSKTAFISYMLIFLFQLLGNLLHTESAALTLLMYVLSWGTLIVYFIFLVKSFLSESNFYKTIGKEQGLSTALIYIFIGMPLYFLMYFYFNKQMKEEIMMIR